MSSRRLPPLNALRAFEAAGRHLSLTRAAEELHVTPAAVSHQVKALEEWLGVSLFSRANRRLRLTDAGKACMPRLGEAFDALAAAVSAACASRTGRALTISVAPSFAARWLVPRLDRFAALHPGVDVRIDASMKLADVGRGEVDLAVRYGPGGYPGLQAECLMSEAFVPVCSPALLEADPGLTHPRDLCHHTLLHVHDSLAGVDGMPDWAMWLRAAGVGDCLPDRGPTFGVASMAIQAALDGQGVALIGQVLVADDLAAGRLVQPFALSFPVRFCYYVLRSPASIADPRIEAFRDWLLGEAGRTISTGDVSGDPARDRAAG